MRYLCLKCGEIYEKKCNIDFILDNTDSYWFCPKSTCHGKLIEIDDNMIAPISLLNKNGIITNFCCGGHVQSENIEPYIIINCTQSKEKGPLIRNSLLKKSLLINLFKTNVTYCIEEFIPNYQSFYQGVTTYSFPYEKVHPSFFNLQDCITLRGLTWSQSLTASEQETLKKLINQSSSLIIYFYHIINDFNIVNKTEKIDQICEVYFKIQEQFLKLEENGLCNFQKLHLSAQQKIINEFNSQLVDLIESSVVSVNKKYNSNLDSEQYKAMYKNFDDDFNIAEIVKHVEKELL